MSVFRALRIKEMRAGGSTYAAIARDLNVSPDRVRQIDIAERGTIDELKGRIVDLHRREPRQHTEALIASWELDGQGGGSNR